MRIHCSYVLALALYTNLVAQVSASDELPPETQSSDARFVHKTVIIPHDDKIHRGGEDAAATSDRFLVVADGVGGWVKHNVNPGLYSRMLTSKVLELGHQNETLSLVDVVHQANWLAAEKHLGSATCTTLKLMGKDQISTLNVGDSGYSIHRRSGTNRELELVYASEPGQKSFNFPYQLGGQYGDEVREVAVESNHTMEPDDIIVVYSDGVSDNMFPAEFHNCLDKASAEDGYHRLVSFALAADCIARTAYFLGKDRSFDSPFAQGARQVGKSYRGGKHDDITVVVAQIRADDSETEDTDPYLEESISVYTGHVKAVSSLPALSELLTDSHDEL